MLSALRVAKSWWSTQRIEARHVASEKLSPAPAPNQTMSRDLQWMTRCRVSGITTTRTVTSPAGLKKLRDPRMGQVGGRGRNKHEAERFLLSLAQRNPDQNPSNV